MQLKKLGFERIMDRLLLVIDKEIISTDRHTGIKSLVKNMYSDCKHQFDCWHMSNSIGKKDSAFECFGENCIESSSFTRHASTF